MRKNRFNILSLEDFDDSQVDGQVEESSTPVADAIEKENSAVELNSEITAFEEHCEQQNDAIDTVTELQEQVDAQEEIIEENPEEVTDATVEVAQEQFYITMNKITDLGYYGTSGTISHELSAGTPLEKLKVSCEGVKEFINKVIEKIVGFFKAIKDWFVKILQKIGILKETEEQAKEILEDTPSIEEVDVDTLESLIEKEKSDQGGADIKSILGFYGLISSNANEAINNLLKGGSIRSLNGYLNDIERLLIVFKDYTSKLTSNKFKLGSVNIELMENTIKQGLEMASVSFKKYYKNFGKEFSKELEGYTTTYPTKLTNRELVIMGMKEDNGTFNINASSINFDSVRSKFDKKMGTEIVKYILTNKNELITKTYKTNTELYKKTESEGKKLEGTLKQASNELEKYKKSIDENAKDLNDSIKMKNNIAVGLQYQKFINLSLTGTILSLLSVTKTHVRLIKFASSTAKSAKKKK